MPSVVSTSRPSLRTRGGVEVRLVHNERRHADRTVGGLVGVIQQVPYRKLVKVGGVRSRCFAFLNSILARWGSILDLAARSTDLETTGRPIGGDQMKKKRCECIEGPSPSLTYLENDDSPAPRNTRRSKAGEKRLFVNLPLLLSSTHDGCTPAMPLTLDITPLYRLPKVRCCCSRKYFIPSSSTKGHSRHGNGVLPPPRAVHTAFLAGWDRRRKGSRSEGRKAGVRFI